MVSMFNKRAQVRDVAHEPFVFLQSLVVTLAVCHKEYENLICLYARKIIEILLPDQKSGEGIYAIDPNSAPF